MIALNSGGDFVKIKAVCAETGLSDRAIRYYIDEGLISPHYTENYLGRKNYDFTQEDVAALKHIATLRSFDFTVEEIRSMIRDSACIPSFIKMLKERIHKAVLDGDKKLKILENLDLDKEYTFGNLAKRLTEISTDTLPQNDDNHRNWYKLIFSVIKSILIFVIVWFPVVLSVFILFQVRIRRYYPVYNLRGIAILLLCWMPSFAVIIISKIHFSWSKIVKVVLLVMCIGAVPYCVLTSMCDVIISSETSDISNYRDFDVECNLNTGIDFDGLFPKYAHTSEMEIGKNGKIQYTKVDAKYYYRFIEDFDSSVDVYAEWTLKQDTFYEEVERVKEFFQKQESDYNVIQQGKYRCLVLEDGWNRDAPFSPVTGSYYYLIFAYDEENMTVRYVYSASLQDGTVQPYYLSLEW